MTPMNNILFLKPFRVVGLLKGTALWGLCFKIVFNKCLLKLNYAKCNHKRKIWRKMKIIILKIYVETLKYPKKINVLKIDQALTHQVLWTSMEQVWLSLPPPTNPCALCFVRICCQNSILRTKCNLKSLKCEGCATQKYLQKIYFSPKFPFKYGSKNCRDCSLVVC